jgi:phosphoglycolate phosphatase-like HAD superfamily hydrolase
MFARILAYMLFSLTRFAIVYTGTDLANAKSSAPESLLWRATQHRMSATVEVGSSVTDMHIGDELRGQLGNAV